MNKGDAEKLEGKPVKMRLKDEYGGTSIEGIFSGLEKGEVDTLKLTTAEGRLPQISIQEDTIQEIVAEEVA